MIFVQYGFITFSFFFSVEGELKRKDGVSCFALQNNLNVGCRMRNFIQKLKQIEKCIS